MKIISEKNTKVVRRFSALRDFLELVKKKKTIVETSTVHQPMLLMCLLHLNN